MGGLGPPHNAFASFQNQLVAGGMYLVRTESQPSVALPWNLLLAKNLVAHRYQPPLVFIFWEKWVSISSSSIVDLGEGDGISAGGSGFPNGYPGKQTTPRQ